MLSLAPTVCLMFRFRSTQTLKPRGYWVRNSRPLKMGLFCLYTDIFLEGQQASLLKKKQPKTCMIRISWRQPIELIKQMCQTLPLQRHHSCSHNAAVLLCSVKSNRHRTFELKHNSVFLGSVCFVCWRRGFFVCSPFYLLKHHTDTWEDAMGPLWPQAVKAGCL